MLTIFRSSGLIMATVENSDVVYHLYYQRHIWWMNDFHYWTCLIFRSWSSFKGKQAKKVALPSLQSKSNPFRHSNKSASSFAKQTSKFLKIVLLSSVFFLHSENLSLIYKEIIYWTSVHNGYKVQGFTSLSRWCYGFWAFHLNAKVEKCSEHCFSSFLSGPFSIALVFAFSPESALHPVSTTGETHSLMCFLIFLSPYSPNLILFPQWITDVYWWEGGVDN